MEELLEGLSDGKDELNLAEFPLCTIADRLPPGQKSLSFEDQVWDAARNEMVARRLTITGSEEFGLPTARDDEVLLGLIQLSKLLNFADRKVFFTRYQLLRVLGWKDESKNYERLEKSLNRWIGVTLYYQNAWRNRSDQSWADEKFHVLDNVTLFERRKTPAQDRNGRQSALPFSSFVWNDTIFRSFQAGNLKKLDFDFYKKLDGAVAKRLFRFLDKRFYHRPDWRFNLKELCWVHIGLSRNYADAASLKRKLKIGIMELERQGFLVTMPDAERFRRLATGEWCVVFEKASTVKIKTLAAPAPARDLGTVVDELVRRGVSPSAASDVAAAHAPEHIHRQLEIFDWLVAQKHRSVSINPAGFLMSSIRGDFAPPKGFVSVAERVKREALAVARRKREDENARAAIVVAERQRQEREEAVKKFWQAWPEEDRQRLEAEILDGASSVERNIMARGGAFAEATRQSLMDAFALKVLEQGL